MIDTSLEAYEGAMSSQIRKAMKSAIWEMLQTKDLSSDCVYESESFQKDWRHFFRDDHQALQDIRRVMSEFQDDGKAWDSGERRKGIYGRKVAVWTATEPEGVINQKLGGQDAPKGHEGIPEAKNKESAPAGLKINLLGAHENWQPKPDKDALIEKYTKALKQISVASNDALIREIARKALAK